MTVEADHSRIGCYPAPTAAQTFDFLQIFTGTVTAIKAPSCREFQLPSKNHQNAFQ